VSDFQLIIFVDKLIVSELCSIVYSIQLIASAFQYLFIDIL